MTTLGALLDDAAAAHAQRPALLSATGSTSYTQLRHAADAIAAGLAASGVSKGTRVGLLMPNRSEWIATAVGVLKLGAVLVPLNTLWRRAELEYALRHVDVGTLIAVSDFLRHDYVEMLQAIAPGLARDDGEQTPGGLRLPELPALRRVIVHGPRRPAAAVDFEALRAAGTGTAAAWLAAAQAEVAPSEEAAIFFTSGTTAAPRGVVHTHASILHAARHIGERLGLTPEDRVWGYLPFFFAGGFVAVALATLSRGGAVILQEVFDAGEALQLMERQRCTTLFAWPHQAEALAAHPAFSPARVLLRKGTGANAAWAARLYAPDHQAVGTWGMTEAGPMAACSRWDEPLSVRAGGHGRALPGVELRVVDAQSGTPLAAGEEGELLVRGPTLMSRYYKVEPRLCFDAEGFFHTGDLARLDADGVLHFAGRTKDVIKTAGASVAAAEVEEVLRQHPQVRLAAVVGVPHRTRGENVAAFVTVAAGSCDEAELIAFCAERLAAYKVPRRVHVLADAELPLLGSGKVDKQALRARAAQAPLPASPLPNPRPS